MARTDSCLFGWPLTSDDVTLSGGSWTLPLTNAQLEALSSVARSADDANASTIVNGDQGSARYVGLVALVGHNLQKDALIRFRLSDSADMSGPAYDSGWTAAWPVQWATGVLPAGHPNAATRLLTNAQILALNPQRNILHILPSDVSARYWRLEIDDDGNTDTYVQFARVLACPTFQPSHSFSVGMESGFDDLTVVGTAVAGARFYDIRPKGRTVTGTLQNIDSPEARTVVRDMQEELGVHGQVYFVTCPQDADELQRRSFLATFSHVSAVQAALSDADSITVVLQEVR